MQSSRSIGSNQSSFAVYARSLDPALLAALNVDQSVVVLTETLVTVCKALTDSDDSRPRHQRLEDCLTSFDEDRFREIFTACEEQLKVDGPKHWVDKFKNESYKGFAERLLGAAQYRLLVIALNKDAAVVALAVRRGVRALAPFAVAWNDALSLTSKSQLKAASMTELLAVNAIQLVISLDDFLGAKVLAALPMETTAATSSDLAAWAPDGPDFLAAQCRNLVTEASARRVERANSPLVRKIRGARDALKYSEDGVSQVLGGRRLTGGELPH
ncbi:hypothetical protein [Streptomyces sp. NPDC015345]|uniref:hypothetical protein n=1 Tax=Streptomyces sp. NPDC015345 TaxID=3364953 RepID=UPI0036FDB87E